mmetsp:Transcript_22331/g.76474  ORF Transcript_22331/g.76474 Transcript_22331/m.76474 type:complete len:338 (-) Transcript_22331:57-1070(-)
MAEDEEADLPHSQWVIFIRHAESRWNRAQADYSIVGLLSENDHGLSEDGRLQAEELRRRVRVVDKLLAVDEGDDDEDVRKDDGSLGSTTPVQWTRLLLKPDRIYSSPFTRAVCTACIGLGDLLSDERPLVLLREAREQKNIGGADSTGVAVGEEIPVRVASELKDLYEGLSEQEVVVEEFRGLQVDVSSCREEWWGAMTGDEEDLIRARVAAVVDQLRRTRGSQPGGGGVAILVGHSLFLRTIFQSFLISGEHRDSMPVGVADALCYSLLPFCGVVATRFEWDEAGTPKIREALPLLGTQLRPPDLSSSRGGGVMGSLSQLTGCACSRKTTGSCNTM